MAYRNSATVPTIDVLGCDKPEAAWEKPLYNSTISHRSSSVKPSMRSSRSRTTLVGYDEELEYKPDTAYGTTNKAKAFTWWDHLLGVFCIRRGGRVSFDMTSMPKPPEENEDVCNSPWILPVYVLSSQKDESRHFIPKEAKCTIDTGNLQGNLVSKAFVTDVLGYPESYFQPLAKAEEAGGTGVTGHKLIPQAAISLTWYHSNSTRVFRDMRFLISEHPMYDLIIGSWSIHQNRILDVPNLMDEHNVLNVSDEELEKQRSLRNKVRLEYAEFKKKVEGPKQSKDAYTMARYNELKPEVEIAEQKLRDFHIRRYWTKYKESNGKDTRKLEKYRKEWQGDFPGEGENIPAIDLGPPKATEGG